MSCVKQALQTFQDKTFQLNDWVVSGAPGEIAVYCNDKCTALGTETLLNRAKDLCDKKYNYQIISRGSHVVLTSKDGQKVDPQFLSEIEKGAKQYEDIVLETSVAPVGFTHIRTAKDLEQVFNNRGPLNPGFSKMVAYSTTINTLTQGYLLNGLRFGMISDNPRWYPSKKAPVEKGYTIRLIMPNQKEECVYHLIDSHITEPLFVRLVTMDELRQINTYQCSIFEGIEGEYL